MSVLQYPEAINAPDLQIWNNAAFDTGNSDPSVSMTSSWCSLQSISINRSESLESDSGKENQSPVFCRANVSLKSPTPLKSLPLNEATGRSQGKPLKLLFKQGMLLPSPTLSKSENEAADDNSKIDTEIQQIEWEISRLTSKLEALRLEKTEKNPETNERGGRMAPAKFMEEKQTKNSATVTKVDEPSTTITGTKFRRRGVSLGPSEINAGVRSRQIGKLEITPIQSRQNRRKSCFWKLEDIKEEVMKQRRRSVSSSPKSRSSVSKTQASKGALTTVCSKKSGKRDDSMKMSSIQPKKLFKEGEKSVPSKKPLKPGRVIASRYNQISVQNTGNPTKSDRRKRFLAENDEDDTKRCDKKRVSVGKSQGFHTEPGRNPENGVKKPWEIQSEAARDRRKSLVNGSELSVLKMADLLPRIRTIRCTDESPRDSGPAKRVANLTEGRSYFCAEETEVEISVCQALSFDEEEVEEKNGR